MYYLKIHYYLSIVFLSFAVTAQEIEEVVVTATKKAESVQDIAISIEALSAESLEENQVYDVSDLAEITPGLRNCKNYWFRFWLGSLEV